LTLGQISGVVGTTTPLGAGVTMTVEAGGVTTTVAAGAVDGAVRGLACGSLSVGHLPAGLR